VAFKTASIGSRTSNQVGEMVVYGYLGAGRADDRLDKYRSIGKLFCKFKVLAGESARVNLLATTRFTQSRRPRKIVCMFEIVCIRLSYM
jgi:hypothetical protein